MKKIIIFSICLLSVLYSISASTAYAKTAAELAAEAALVAEPGARQDTCAPGSGTVCINNPLGKDMNTPQKFIGRIISGLLGVIGSIALVMFVLGGFKWMTSAGDKNKVASGRDTMLWAVLGLTVVFSSYALVKFVIEKVAG